MTAPLTSAQKSLLARMEALGTMQVSGHDLRVADGLVAKKAAKLVPRGPNGEVCVPFATKGWYWSLEPKS